MSQKPIDSYFSRTVVKPPNLLSPQFNSGNTLTK